MASESPSSAPPWWKLALDYGRTFLYISMWICTSAAVILFNKYILTKTGFKFPITLTAIHMLFGSVLSFLLCRVCKLFPTLGMTGRDYLHYVAPIGVLFALVLSLANGVYLYLSVSFIQVLISSSRSRGRLILMLACVSCRC